MEIGPAERGQRPVRIANCSGMFIKFLSHGFTLTGSATGAMSDPGYQMLRQIEGGPIDFVTGDYLAEINIAANAEKYKNGIHPGYEPTARDGLKLSLDALNEKRVKVVINGGAQNPEGLAREVNGWIKEKNLDLTVAYVYGDNLIGRVDQLLRGKDGKLHHLDEENSGIHYARNTGNFLDNPKKPIVSANAYLGARAIRKGLEEGADIVVCGRVADASPVIGAAQWWSNWKSDDYDYLAGALIAGHLIECSAYVTGANFAGFYKYLIEQVIDVGFPIAEISSSGECDITKHDCYKGFVTEDTVKCQLLYELQGSAYLNSDVKAILTHVKVEEAGKNRVHVSGIKGLPPPPTTKFAVFYKGGYQCEYTQNATGYATSRKWDLLEAQTKDNLKKFGVLEKFDILEFQRVGTPEPNPRSQLASTTYMRVFAQAEEPTTLQLLLKAGMEYGMQHFLGLHGSLDFRTAIPMPFLAYFPAILDQGEIEEGVKILGKDGTEKTFPAGHPSKYELLGPRENYETTDPVSIEVFGPTRTVPLGDIALARSGDKGANVNIGLFVHTDEEWVWFRSYMTKERMKQLIGDDWQDWFFLERIEMPHIRAVHFVCYGILGRGVSSSSRLDQLGKGFGEFIRDRYVDVPVRFFE
ncbi:MAG: hypothetical protein M1834_009388 [Cirrosporium novae-zelandiae]|nr:MAG: hypothetical protein M1834_009388 [Cirrosporium novae-zelandiae]